VPAEEPAAAFVEVPAALWRDVLCVQEERRVGNDNCVRWHGREVFAARAKGNKHALSAGRRGRRKVCSDLARDPAAVKLRVYSKL
jgi:hypothetical protein